MHKDSHADRSCPRLTAGALGLCFLAVSVFAAGCADHSGEADARRLLSRSLAVMEERGLSIVPDKTGMNDMIARQNIADWRPFAQVADLERQAASVSMASGGPGSREAELVINLKPEAAKEMLKRRLVAELEAVREESRTLLPHGEEGGGADLAGRIGERLAEAEKELADMLAAAEVETVVRMRVDRKSAVPSDVRMVTRIVRPAMTLSASGNGDVKDRETAANGFAGSDNGGDPKAEPPSFVEETITDAFIITTLERQERIG